MGLRDNWDRELELGLPDCRLSNTVQRERKTVKRGPLTYEMCFCANCGEPDGLVSAEWTPHVFCLCNKCAEFMRAKPLPGIVEVPEHIVRGGPL
jgi:hypothetical protein